jgi:hypothetical protein
MTEPIFIPDPIPCSALRFDRVDETAAFIGALTRFMHSPASDSARLMGEAVRVWSVLPPDGRTTELYLNDAALAVSEATFSPLPSVVSCSSDEFPAGVSLVVNGLKTPPLGLAEAREHLMKLIPKVLMLFGCLCLGAAALTPATALASPTKRREAVADKLHTPPEGSTERKAILDGLRRHWQTSRNPDDGRTYRGKIRFRVNYLKAHNGWAWVHAEPHSSLSKERFPENSGFLLQLNAGRWDVMKLPLMDDNGDGAFNPSPADLERIKKMYPSIATEIIPIEKRR